MRPAAMLATKGSTGVTHAVNLGHPLCAGEEARKRRIHPGFEMQGRYHQKSKTLLTTSRLMYDNKEFEDSAIIWGVSLIVQYQWPHKKNSYPPKCFYKKKTIWMSKTTNITKILQKYNMFFLNKWEQREGHTMERAMSHQLNFVNYLQHCMEQ